MAPSKSDDHQVPAPFEGPEKLLEIWFAPSAAAVPGNPGANGKAGLRQVDRKVWDEMLDIVKCKILSVMEGLEIDAYLLSESSLFIFPHKLILKTCGTTLNLLGLPRILEIAAQHATMPMIHRLFYSRKSFMFPERQKGLHRDWKQEVEFLDTIFNGAAYTIGKANGDHWLLYMVSLVDPQANSPLPSKLFSSRPQYPPDHTIEILMSDLAKHSRAPFFNEEQTLKLPADLARTVSYELGITDIFPSRLSRLDAYSFIPCGYSSNALINLQGEPTAIRLVREGYFTIHVTPEEGWSYASFECNVPLSTRHNEVNTDKIPNMATLVQRVVSIFQPRRLTLTLFISANSEEFDCDIEAAQRSFHNALVAQTSANNPATKERWQGAYQRTDKINYEFEDYGLAFASFELLN